MKKINKKDLGSLKFDGIIVGEKNNKIHFIVECAYYSTGQHGYPEKGYNPSESSFFNISYNTKYLPNGLFFNSTTRLPLDNYYMNFEDTDYYKFDNMEEFCEWYLQRKNRKKDQVPEKRETRELHDANMEFIYWDLYTDNFTSPELKKKIEEDHPNFKDIFHEYQLENRYEQCKCNKKQKRKEKLKDVIKFLELQKTVQDGLDRLLEHQYCTKEVLDNILAQVNEDQQKLNDWLEEEV